MTNHKERNALIEQYIQPIRNLALRLIRIGQRPTIELDDLVQEGLLSCIEQVDAGRYGPCVLQRAGERTAVFIRGEVEHWENRKNWSEMFDAKGREKF